jgi:hypothetical protein
LKNKIDRTKELELKLEKLTKKKERDKLKLIKNQEMWLKVVHDQYALDMKRIENEKKVSTLNRFNKKGYLRFSNVRNNIMVSIY